MRHKSLVILSSMLVLALGLGGNAQAQESVPAGTDAAVGTAFTYQGQLQGASSPVSGNCDFQFSLWDALTGGAQVGTTQSKTNVALSSGLFTVTLDFGTSAFAGSARWLGIAVRCPAGSGSYTTLTPRQALTPVPYALYSANADKLDGQHASSFQRHYQNMVVVAKSGGDYATITAALNSITTAGAANPFLVYVAPGVYTETVTMKPYVDIEGAGELATKITFTSSSTITSTVTGSDNAELRFLTVENTGGDFEGGDFAIAISNHNASPRITHVTAAASSGTFGSHNYGIYNINSSPTMMYVNVNATSSSYQTSCGVNNDHSSPAMTNVTASSGGRGLNVSGVYNYHSSPVMLNVTAKASTTIGENYEGPDTSAYGVYNDTSSPAMTNVTAIISGGDFVYGVYNSSSSPVMKNIIATVSGGYGSYYTSYDKSYGVYNDSSSPTMTDVTATASGGSNNYGVYNDQSSPAMSNVKATASGGTNSYGVYNDNSSPTMMNVTATAPGGTNGYGMWNTNSSLTIQNSVMYGGGSYTGDGIHNSATVSGSYIVKINNSQVSGGSSTIYSDSSDYTTWVGASQLVGNGGQGSGNYTCVASYNGSYAALDSSCQP